MSQSATLAASRAEQQTLRPVDVERIYGLRVNHLAKLRLSGNGPCYFKVGGKLVLYRPCDIDAWIAKGRRNSTGEGR